MADPTSVSRIPAHLRRRGRSTPAPGNTACRDSPGRPPGGPGRSSRAPETDVHHWRTAHSESGRFLFAVTLCMNSKLGQPWRSSQSTCGANRSPPIPAPSQKRRSARWRRAGVTKSPSPSARQKNPIEYLLRSPIPMTTPNTGQRRGSSRPSIRATSRVASAQKRWSNAFIDRR